MPGNVIFTEGYDAYNGTQTNIGLQSRWQATNWNAPPSLEVGRFGGQCMAFSEDRFGDGCETRASINQALGTFTVAHAFRCSSIAGMAANSANTMIQLLSGTNLQLGWRPNPDGSISVYRMTGVGAGVLLGTSAANILQTNVWHWIDFSGTISTTTGTIIFKVDGNTLLNLTAQNTQGYATTATFDTISVNAHGVMTNAPIGYIDDIYVTDSATTLGERRVETIRPSADTASKAFLPDSGTTNYNRVNDTTVNGASYVQSSNVGDLDLYEMVDIVGTPVTIDAVTIVAFATKSDAGARSLGLVADIGGTQLQSPDNALTASLARYAYLMQTKPGGGAWDITSVINLRVGPKVTV